MTSILTLFNLETRQAEAATLRGTDIAVTAGAGSGKTRALVGRYLSLIEDGVPLRSIVAITFTEKAAREMRTRIRSFIERMLAEQPAQPLWEAAFSELDAARIGTIHSLCAAILRAHPAEAGVDPDFAVLEEATAAALQAQSVGAALAWATTDPGAARLFGLLSEQGLRDAVAGLLVRRLDSAPAFDAVGNAALAVWEPALRAAVAAFTGRDDVRAAVADLLALRDGGVLVRVAGDKLAPQVVQLLERWSQFEAAQASGNWDAALDSLFALRRECLGGGAGKAGPAKEAVKLLREAYDTTLDPWLGGKAATDKPARWSLDRQVAAALPDLRRVFAAALAEYDRLKDTRQALDFDDLETRAVALLEQHPEVRAHWQTEAQAVLVDEFQDTNERQRRLVYALAYPILDFRFWILDSELGIGDPKSEIQNLKSKIQNRVGRLFVVGDPKQSIYRFRGADVTVFRTVQADVRASGGRVIDLDLTFRAHAPLVTVANALLAPVLGEADDPTRPYQVPFAPLRAYRPAPDERFAEPHVEFHLGLGDNADAGRRSAAAALADRLRALNDTDRVAWGEMALLFRASTAFGVYEDALERAGIPFVTVAGQGFYDRPEVRDLLNALAALADPADDLALAGLLRSPAFALSDVALYLLRWGPDGTRRPLWAALNGDLAHLASDDASRAHGAREIIARLRHLAGRVPVAEVLKHLLDATHYRAMLRLASGERLRRNVDKLLADAHRSGLVVIGEFLEYVQTLRDVAAREGEAPVEAGGAVQLMTVHKAKGLEFPVVVIADAAHQLRGGSRPLLVHPHLGVLLRLPDEEALPAIHRLATLREAEMDDAEDRRLLYVAATRAREKLIVSGHTRLKQGGGLELQGWLKRLGEVVGLAEVRLDGTLALPHTIPLSCAGGPLGCVLHPPAAVGFSGNFRGDLVGIPNLLGVSGVPPQPVGDSGTPTTGIHKEPEVGAGEPILPIVVPLSFDLIEPLALAGHQNADEKTRERESDPPPRVWRVVPTAQRPRGPARVVGQLVHAALHRWRFPTTAGEQGGRPPIPPNLGGRGAGELEERDPDSDFDRDSFGAFLRPYAYQVGLTDPAEIDAVLREAARLLARFQAHPLYAEMAAAERHHELPFSVPHGDGARSGIVDVLYRTGDQWTVVEFQTDRLDARTDLREHIREKRYDDRLRDYVTAVEQQLDQRPRALLVFLNVEGKVRVVPL